MNQAQEGMGPLPWPRSAVRKVHVHLAPELESRLRPRIEIGVGQTNLFSGALEAIECRLVELSSSIVGEREEKVRGREKGQFEAMYVTCD